MLRTMEEQYIPDDYNYPNQGGHQDQYSGDHSENQYYDGNYYERSQAENTQYFYSENQIQTSPGLGSYYQNYEQPSYPQQDDHGQLYNNDQHNPARASTSSGLDLVPVPKFLRDASQETSLTSPTRAGLSSRGLSSRGLSSRMAGFRKSNSKKHSPPNHNQEANDIMSMMDSTNSEDVFENAGPTQRYPTSSSNINASIRGLRGKQPPHRGLGLGRARTPPMQKNPEPHSTRSFGSGSLASEDVLENEGKSFYISRSNNTYKNQQEDIDGYSARSAATGRSSHYYPSISNQDSTFFSQAGITADTYRDEKSSMSVPGYPARQISDYTRRERMPTGEDQSVSSTSIPGAHYVSGESARDAKACRSAAVSVPNANVRGHDSLRLLDQNIQQSINRMSDSTSGSRAPFNRNTNLSSESTDSQRYSYEEAGASMRSVENDRQAEKIRSQQARMKASLRTVDGMSIAAQGFISQRVGMSSTNNRQETTSRPGMCREVSQYTPQDAALRAPLDNHLGIEPETEQRAGDFSHVRMLQPRRYDSPYVPTPRAAESIGTDTDQENDSVEVHEDEPDQNFEPRQSRSRRQVQARVTVPRELTVDEDVEQARTSIKGNKDGPSLWFLTKVGAFIFLCFVGATVGIYLGLVVFKGEPESNAGRGDDVDDLLGFEEGLPTTTLAILADKDPDAPQYMAMQWLQAEELFASYPVWRKRQRFALCTIYFELFHKQDEEDLPWFQHDVDECEWIWNPDDPNNCDVDGRYTQLSLRFDHRQDANNLELFDVVDSTSVNASFMNDNASLMPIHKPISMPLEIGMLQLDHFKLSHVPRTTELPYLLRAEMLATNELVKLEITRSPDLGGTIPTAIGLLSDLQYLYLEDTNIIGRLPSELGHLSQLKELNIAECPNLSGKLPSELGLLSELELLWVFSNQNLTGSLPSELGLMTSVNFLSMRSNALIGTIPSELGRLTMMGEFKLNDNDISGTIPSELGGWSMLRIFDISENRKLGGRVPEGICALGADLVDYEMDCRRIECCDHWTGT